MRTLTEAESELINNSVHTVDYSDVAEEIDEEYCQDEFENHIAGKYDEQEDLGGLTVYFKDDKLVAFYDYEQFVGTIF